MSELRAVVERAVSESVSEVVPQDTQDAMSALVGLPDRLERIVKEAAKGKASKAEADLAAMRQVTAQQKVGSWSWKRKCARSKRRSKPKSRRPPKNARHEKRQRQRHRW